MSFVAEPYGTFVEDLLANLTGGASRMRFRFVEEELPFRLGDHERALPRTVRLHGTAGGEFRQFERGRDFDVDPEGTVVWRAQAVGVRAAGATWPDPGTDVWVGFDRAPGGTPPLLDDRNPGSVVRTLAEAFAREYAVLSHQLDLVYESAFVDTAQGRDLEQVAALVAVSRRGATHARGEVVFQRATPAPADITVPAGSLVSTAGAPQVTVETTGTVTLRRGAFSVATPVRAVRPGPEGVAPARSLTVAHRPVFGVDSLTNPDALTFGGGAEPDDELRARVKRALATSGRSTPAAIKGALASLEGIREQDVLVQEDHLASPGLVRVTVAADVDATTQILASRLLEDHRPAGIRVVHNLPAPTTPLPTLAEHTGGGGDGPTGTEAAEGVFSDVSALLTLTPAGVQLSAEQKDDLATRAAAALREAVDAVGAGEPLVYNRLVAGVMAVEGLLDAVLEIGWAGGARQRYNLRPSGGTRPRLRDGDLSVSVRGDRVVLDVSVTVERLGLAASTQASAALAAIQQDVERRLVDSFLVTREVLDEASLLGVLPATDDYRVEAVRYNVELVDEGLRVTRPNVRLQLDPGQVVWVRSVSVAEPVGSS